MSNRIPYMVAGLMVLAILVDALLNGGAAVLFLLRKLADFVEYLSFWR